MSSVLSKYEDFHGNEIYGLKEARSKKDKINALRDHLSWLKTCHQGAEEEIEHAINELGLDSKPCPRSNHSTQEEI